MYIIVFIISLILFDSDEKTNIRPVPVNEIRQQLELFAIEENLSKEDRAVLEGVLQFNDFVGVDINGNWINYSNPELGGYISSRVVIHGYYAEWCVNCRQNLPSALRLYQKYHNKGLEIVLSYMYSNPERIREYVRENEIPFPVLIGSEDREIYPEVRLETTHYILRTLLDDYRRWGTPFYIIHVKDIPDTWYIVAGEFIESEVDEFLARHLTTN